MVSDREQEYANIWLQMLCKKKHLALGTEVKPFLSSPSFCSKNVFSLNILINNDNSIYYQEHISSNFSYFHKKTWRRLVIMNYQKLMPYNVGLFRKQKMQDRHLILYFSKSCTTYDANVKWTAHVQLLLWLPYFIRSYAF